MRSAQSIGQEKIVPLAACFDPAMNFLGLGVTFVSSIHAQTMSCKLLRILLSSKLSWNLKLNIHAQKNIEQ